MKKINTILLTLISIFCSCNTENKIEEKKYSLDLDFSNKQLNRLYYGNKYYGINGISYKQDHNQINLKRPNDILFLESKDKFINNFKSLALLENPLEIKLHEYEPYKAIPIEIKFNQYINEVFYMMPLFSIENLELLKNRSAKIYSLKDFNNLTPFYIDEFNYYAEDININEIVIYSETIKNINRLKDIGLFPTALESIKFVLDPISGLYSLYPDLRFFSKKENKILDSIIFNLKKENQPEKIIEYQDYNINNDIILKKDLILKNVHLKVKSGVKISLTGNSSIYISDSKVEFAGKKDDRMVFKGLGENSLMLNRCEEVTINQMDFNNMSNLSNDSIIVPAAITFYNSNVKINNSSFKNNKRGDDFVNFYNSKFKISNSKFININADAVDSDFSVGSIIETEFINIGNDAVDFSGSDVEIDAAIFKLVKDKSVSAGENSILSIYNSKFENNELAIVVKDGSFLKSVNNYFKNNKLDFCAFMKKTFYKQPEIEIDFYNNESYMVQKDVKIHSKNFNEFVKLDKDIESLLYGNIYGKSSK